MVRGAPGCDEARRLAEVAGGRAGACNRAATRSDANPATLVRAEAGSPERGGAVTVTRRLRPAPRTPGDAIPESVRQWFAREREGAPWEAVLPGTVELIAGWWRAWRRKHPGARPPHDAPWITWPR
jgi:hypothetical protein